MTGWRLMTRLAERARGWLKTPEGRAALNALHTMLARTLRRTGTRQGL